MKNRNFSDQFVNYVFIFIFYVYNPIFVCQFVKFYDTGFWPMGSLELFVMPKRYVDNLSQVEIQ